MSCCKREESNLYIDNNNCANHDDTPFCLCRYNGGCLVPTSCNTLCSVNNATVNLEPCQCMEEMEWNCYTPPKPSCKWLSNFSELRRRWSNHARQRNCKCCNCKPRINMTNDVMSLVYVDNAIRSASHTCMHTSNNGWKKENAHCSLLSYIGNIGYTILVPGPLALVSFILLILIMIGLSLGLTIYPHYFPKKCLKNILAKNCR
ncbi:uncharacterized protein LOC143426254 [Xylocopa sonorina]|uniref:uncharacterized protein LOC143426254 n=1 Tax=Xylocopa sonorina TaxID=1818115 RepID=UPI00403AA096